MKFRLNREEKFILTMAIVVIAFLFVRHMFLMNTEEQVESAYEAGYSSAMEDVVSMSTIVETYEQDGDCHVLFELPDGNIHEWVSPAAKG